MRPAQLFATGVALALATAALAPAPARAAWVPFGNPICTLPEDQWGARIVSDGGDGAFVVWLDRRRGFPNADLYATRLLADGSIAPGWPVNGGVLSATGFATAHSPVPDGAGGLMVFWFDQSTYQARMQHVDGSGALAPGFPADGMILPITIGGPTGYVVRAVSDAAGGAYFLWNSFDGFKDVFYLTRLTGSGAFAGGWNATGVTQAFADQFNPFAGFSGVLLAADPGGGAHVAANWSVEDFPSGSHGVSSIRGTLPDGTVAYGGGLSGPSTGFPLSLAPDLAGGTFTAWSVAGQSPARRMQHFSSTGVAQWPNPTEAPVSDEVQSDGSGGLYLFGRPPGTDRLELHRRAGDASIPAPWTPAGFVATTTGSYYSFRAVHSGNQVYACWSTSNPVATDLRAVAVTPDGALAPGWHAGGTVVCDLNSTSVLTSMMPFGLQDALIAWEDHRAFNLDIYVTKLEPGGPVTLDAPGGGPAVSALAFAARSPSPNPARGAMRFDFTLPEAREAELELVDVTGRVRARLEVEPRAGAQSRTFDATRLPAGLYWGRLRQGEEVTAVRFSVLH